MVLDRYLLQKEHSTCLTIFEVSNQLHIYFKSNKSCPSVNIYLECSSVLNTAARSRSMYILHSSYGSVGTSVGGGRVTVRYGFSLKGEGGKNG